MTALPIDRLRETELPIVTVRTVVQKVERDKVSYQ
jgi:hypothetical protein